MAYKYTNPWTLACDVLLFGNLLLFGQGVPRLAQKGSRFSRSGTGLNHRLGNILGALKGAAHINPLPGRGYRTK